ncbi:phenylacetate--CoA ligase [Oscillospiraceae bacterium MB08-C2-2]|nr:phenylacetate--CoA ligase [Oscillospiraceae bacterium MB08-C2-2]
MPHYFNEEIECASREKLRELQSWRLRETVARCYTNVPFYRKKLDEMGLSIGDIQSVDDLSKLPFTVKQDFRDTYPFGLFAVPRDQLVRVHASSGTTGKQTVVGYTQRDIDDWAEDAARALVAAGATKSDFVHVAYGYGLFTGGLGLHYGVERLGATAIPCSSGNTKRQIDIIQDFGSNILCCTPSYALFIAETLREKGIDPASLPLRAGIFGAEPWTEEMRKEIEEQLCIKAYDIYGLSEIMGPGVSFECCEQTGMHINEDKFIPEIINPETGEVLPDGEQGELVFTCIAKEALPLLRYRTRDIASLSRQPCSCGRTLIKMSKPCGRTDDMLIIRGVNVFPSQIESVLLELNLATPNYHLVVDRIDNLDTLEVQVELGAEMFSDTVRSLEYIEKKIKSALLSTLGLAATVKLVEPKTISRSEGKAKRVTDNRKL